MPCFSWVEVRLTRVYRAGARSNSRADETLGLAARHEGEPRTSARPIAWDTSARAPPRPSPAAPPPAGSARAVVETPTSVSSSWAARVHLHLRGAHPPKNTTCLRVTASTASSPDLRPPGGVHRTSAPCPPVGAYGGRARSRRARPRTRQCRRRAPVEAPAPRSTGARAPCAGPPPARAGRPGARARHGDGHARLDPPTIDPCTVQASGSAKAARRAGVPHRSGRGSCPPAGAAAR
jgi:hypothetical protein